ncbi:putative drug exporter of the RND superfamily [Streptomyces sp. 3213]|nr:putative drug exporter of the RND superfamily [Streptomyces sp. 3213] [Streptomyces sp. 3213.3]
MATFLHRLGQLAFQRRWLVTLFWVTVLAAVGFAAVKAPEALDEGSSMPGIESQKTFDLLGQPFPGSAADGANARIVFVAPHGGKITAPANRAVVEKLVTEAADGSQVASAVGPFTAKAVSEDATTAYATVTFEVTAHDLTEASKSHLQKARASSGPASR